MFMMCNKFVSIYSPGLIKSAQVHRGLILSSKIGLQTMLISYLLLYLKVLISTELPQRAARLYH